MSLMSHVFLKLLCVSRLLHFTAINWAADSSVGILKEGKLSLGRALHYFQISSAQLLSFVLL